MHTKSLVSVAFCVLAQACADSRPVSDGAHAASASGGQTPSDNVGGGSAGVAPGAGGAQAAGGGGDSGAHAGAAEAGGGGAGGGGSGAGGDFHTPVGVGRPPTAPAQAPTASGAAVSFEVRAWRLGDTDAAGTPSASAWDQYGYDLDGYSSTPSFAGHCRVAAGADAAAVMTDGPFGIDNAFGKLVLPILSAMTSSSTPSKDATAQIELGFRGVILYVPALGAAPDAVGVVVDPFESRALEDPSQASWNSGTSPWAIADWQLADPASPSSLVSSMRMAGYVTGDQLVAVATSSPLYLSLRIGSVWLTVAVRSAVVTLPLGPERKSASGGVLAGIISAAELREWARSQASALGTCGSAEYESLVQKLTASADILLDGTQDPAKPCDGISFGIGLDLLAIALHPGVVEPLLAPQSCPP